MAELIEKDLVYKIIGCAMDVHKQLGHGLREKTYENALCVEFDYQKLNFSQQHKYPVNYRGKHIDDYIPDLEVENRVIVETKTVDKIIDEHRGQVLNYLKISGIKVGLIINFKHDRLEYERLVLTRQK